MITRKHLKIMNYQINSSLFKYNFVSQEDNLLYYESKKNYTKSNNIKCFNTIILAFSKDLEGSFMNSRYFIFSFLV